MKDCEIISLREFARRNEVGEKTIRDGIKSGKLKKGITYVNGAPKIIYSIAQKEFIESGLGTKILLKKDPEPKEKTITDILREKGSDIDLPKEIDEILSNDTSLANATRLEKIYKAKLAKYESDQKAGILVEKSAVYSELYTFGRELRNGLLLVPDEITDRLMGIKDRTDFRNLLYDSIADKLARMKEYLNEEI